MATTTPYRQDYVSDEDDEDEPLFKRVQKDPEVCVNCFRRFCQVYPINGVWLHGRTSQAAPLRRSVRDIVTDERIPNDDTETLPRDPVTRGTRQVCPCGCPRGTTDRPLTKRRFMAYADRLYRRLCETASAPICRQTFLTECYRRKTDPAEQFADDRLFAAATRSARQAVPT